MAFYTVSIARNFILGGARLERWQAQYQRHNLAGPISDLRSVPFVFRSYANRFPCMYFGSVTASWSTCLRSTHWFVRPTLFKTKHVFRRSLATAKEKISMPKQTASDAVQPALPLIASRLPTPPTTSLAPPRPWSTAEGAPAKPCEYTPPSPSCTRARESQCLVCPAGGHRAARPCQNECKAVSATIVPQHWTTPAKAEQLRLKHTPHQVDPSD